MYEELVKRLRRYVEIERSEHHGAELEAEAADAIEKLSRKIESLESMREITPEAEYAIDKHADNIISRMEKMIISLENKPRWIPVTERFPDAYEDVMLKFPNNQAAGFVDRDGCWAVYSGDGFYTEVADNEPKPTHWMKKLPEPPKEETPAGPYDLLYEEGEAGTT